jgi:hypothetical protein
MSSNPLYGLRALAESGNTLGVRSFYNTLLWILLVLFPYCSLGPPRLALNDIGRMSGG